MDKGKTIILVVVALVVLGLLIWVGSNQSTMPENNVNGDEVMEENNDNNNNNVDSQDEVNNSQNEGEESQQNDLPPAVFNTSGSITNVGSSSITVQTDGSHLSSGENVEVVVVITSTTNILDADNNNISLSDLNEGDSVSIEGSGNIKDLTEFPGSNIKLIN